MRLAEILGVPCGSRLRGITRNSCVLETRRRISSKEVRDGDSTQTNRENIGKNTWRKDAVILGALSKEGYEVIHCDSVRKAWGFVYPHPPHLIIVHLNDPNRAGLAVPRMLGVG
jgi:hypothetical protein